MLLQHILMNCYASVWPWIHNLEENDLKGALEMLKHTKRCDQYGVSINVIKFWIAANRSHFVGVWATMFTDPCE
eukprot:4285804-Karenia_brevis.AAC.1